jgi:membrane protease YdiL (CAAX protease family)
LRLSARTAAILTGVAAAVVWIATDALPWPARAWTVALLALLPPLLIAQAAVADQALELPRLAIYTQSAIMLWALAIVTGIVASASDIGLLQLGLLTDAEPDDVLIATAATFTAGLALVLIADRLGLEDPPLVKHLLPVTRDEKIAFVGLSFTAGFCEELVFRAFLITALVAATGMIPLAVLLSSGVFGMLHAYQRPAGAARAALLGVLLAVPFLWTGSILPSVFAHAALDLAAGFWLRARD